MRTPSACTGLLLALLPVLSAPAGTPDDKNVSGKELIQPANAHPMYWGTINTGIKTNDAYTDGNFSIVAPVWSSLGADATLSGSVLFLEPYVSYGEGGEVAASLGLGFRHLFGSQPLSALTNHDGHQAGFFEEGAFIGANLFVDMLDTEANNQFWQLGVGFEAGTRYLEVRGNYYIPLSDKQLAEEFRTRETRRSASSRTNQSTTALNGSDPYATGNAIVQDALFNTSVTTTTRTTTIERLFRRYEEGMEGWDAEVALLVPGLDKYFDLRLIGGYFSFDNQPFGPQEGGTGNVEGWKAGVEIRPVPAVILSGTWYEDERLTGSDWTAGVQLQLPFEMGDLGDGKGFWGRIGDSFRPRRRHLIERLAEPVHRQNAAIKIANSQQEEETTTSTKVQRVTKVVSSRPGRLVLADDIVFVNNGEAVGNGIQAGDSSKGGADGTAEHPFDTVAEGADTAGSNSNTSGKIWSVYAQGGTGITYDDIVEVSGSTKFISSFTPIVGSNGRSFGGNTARPILEGGIIAIEVPFVQVTAYDIRMGTENGAIYAENVGSLVVNQNLFDTISHGVHVEATGGASAKALVTQNVINTVTTGILAEVHDNNSRLELTATDNELNSAVSIETFDASTFVGSIENNLFNGDMEHGVGAVSNNTSSLQVEVSRNQFEGSYLNGVYALGNGASTVIATVDGNTLSGTFTQGVNLESIGAAFDFDVMDNDLSGTFVTGIRLNRERLNGLNGTIGNGSLDVLRNQLSGTFSGDGILVQSRTIFQPNTTAIELDISDNLLSGAFNRGIYVTTTSNNHVNAVVSNNVFTPDSEVATTGIYLRSDSLSEFIVSEFNGNVLGGTSVTGIRLERSVATQVGGHLIVNGTLNNQVSNETGNKLEVVDPTNGDRRTGGQFYLNGQLITLPPAASPFVVP